MQQDYALVARHAPDVLHIAAVALMCEQLMQRYSEQAGVDVESQVATFRLMVESHLIDREIHPHELRAALADLADVMTSSMMVATRH
jgi:hypothetical protein